MYIYVNVNEELKISFFSNVFKGVKDAIFQNKGGKCHSCGCISYLCYIDFLRIMKFKKRILLKSDPIMFNDNV